MIKPQEILQQFGLSDQEADIYLTALATGPKPVSVIAKKAHKTRTAAYFHITKLFEKGVLKESRTKGKRLIVALPPQELAARFDRLTTDFKSLVPQLTALHRAESGAPVIRITESRQGYGEIYDAVSSLPAGKHFRVFEGRKAMEGEVDVLSDAEWTTFFSRIIERKIETKAVFTTEALTVPMKRLNKKNFELLRQRIWYLRTLSEDVVPFHDLFFIYGTTIAFVFPQIQLVMTIQHEGVANAFGALFDGLFNLARPVVAPWKTG